MAAVSLTLSYGFVALILVTVTFTPITAIEDACELICKDQSNDLEKCMDKNHCDITSMDSVKFDLCVTPCWLEFDQCVGFCRRQAIMIIQACKLYVCKKSKDRYCVHQCYLKKMEKRKAKYLKLKKIFG